MTAANGIPSFRPIAWRLSILVRQSRIFFSSAIGWKDVQYQGNVFNPGYDGCPPAALQKLGVSYDLMQTRVSPQEK